MKPILIEIGFLFFVLAAAQANDPEADRKEVIKTVKNYIEGWYEGSAERMDMALHPALVKRGIMKSKAGRTFLQPVGKSAMVEYAASGYGKTKDGKLPECKVEILDISGNMAIAKSVSPDFIDQIQLVRLDGKWKILHVIWEFNPERGKK